MSISLEKIDSIRNRTNVTYQEAKEALEKCNFDEVEALIYLENKNNSKVSNQKTEKIGVQIRKLIDKLNKIKCTLHKDGKTYLNLPLTIIIIAGLFLIPATPLVIIGLVVLVALGFKVTIKEDDKEPIELSKAVEDTIEKVKNVVNTEKNE